MSYDHLQFSPGYEDEYDFAREGAKKVHVLKSGIYGLHSSPFRGPYLRERKMHHDELIKMNGSVAKNIMEGIQHFWTQDVQDAFKRYKMMHRRGILVYGPPGTGKSSMFMQIVEDFVAERPNGNIVLFDPHPRSVMEYIGYVRQIDPTSRFLVIFEEFEGKLASFESDLLSLMDGENSVSGVVFLAATNYLNQIPERFKNRPSRFADVIELGPPDASVREVFITKRMHPLDLKNINVQEWVEKTDGFVLDHIKDLFISVHCLGLTLNTATEKIRKMMQVENSGN